MGYVGRGLNQEGGQYRKLDSISSNFDGSEVSFNLTIDGLDVTPTAQNLLISLGGVIQEPGTAFSVVGSTITFASAPDSSATFFGVLMGEASFIARGTVGAAEMGITAGAVTASAGLVVDSAKNLIGFNNISASKFEGTFSGALSSSAQIADNISGSSAEPSGNVSGSSTSTGSFGKVELGDGKITTAGNITLDADGAQIRLEDGGTEFGRISRVSSDLVIKSISNNNDILFKGVDGSSTITALQLDMSEAGNAIFNNDVTVAGTLTAQEIHTEFTSASILFTSGSTKFGNSADDIQQMTGSLRITGSGDHYIQTGNLGIGTNNPTVQLEVFGSADQQIRIDSTGNRAQLQFDGKKTSDAEFAEINFANDGDSAAAIHAMRDGANDAARLAFMTQATGGSVTERMSIDSTGKVGIGNDNPPEPLTVEGNISGSGTGSFAVLKTGDLELENERGHWSIVEEAEYLSIRNVKTNKMYKFVLEEIE